MKNSLIPLAMLLICIAMMLNVTSLANRHHDVTKGDEAIVPDWEWVMVLNTDIVVKSGNNDFYYGRPCGVKTGGRIKVIGEINADSVLVIYTSPEKVEYGTSCPSTIVFGISKKHFSEMTSEYTAKMGAQAGMRDREKIKNLLKKNK